MEKFVTSDIYLAATLCARDYTLLNIDKVGDRYSFNIENWSKNPINNEIQMEVDNYWAGNLLIDPKRLFYEFKQIKNRMYDLKRENEKY